MQNQVSRTLLGGILFLLISLADAQDLRYESVVVNIEVCVRVFSGGNFVDSLTLDDFEVTDDGVNPKIEASLWSRKPASSGNRPPSTRPKP